MAGGNHRDAWLQKAGEVMAEDATFFHHRADRGAGPCPSDFTQCGQTGTGKAQNDGFCVWPEGNWWCRKCERRGFYLERNDRPAKEEIAAQRRERYQAAMKQLQQHESDWQTYHENVNRDLWYERFMSDTDIVTWGLGFCNSAPLSRKYENGELIQSSPSITIPVFFNGKLIDIRHRLINPPEGTDMKYTSHVKGLHPAFWNADAPKRARTIVVVEGEIKAMTVTHAGFEAMSYPGNHTFKRIVAFLNREASPDHTIIVWPDPGTEELIGGLMEGLTMTNRYIIPALDKPDDFINDMGTTAFQDAVQYSKIRV